jgi:hypothetical protein
VYRGRKVVAFTPFGRERTANILSIYLARDHQRGIVDEWWACMNMDNAQTGDATWIENVSTHLDWLRIVKRPCAGYEHCVDHGRGNDPMCLRRCERYDGQPADWSNGPRRPKQMNTGRFYWLMQEPDTIFVRFDDDVIWVHEQAITAMIDVLLDSPDRPLCVFPVIWNNAVASHYLQTHGHFPSNWQKVRPNAIDPVGWGNPRFAAGVHDLLLHHLEHDNPDACLTPDHYWLTPTQRFSVSCFAISGAEYCAPDIMGVLDWDEEEHWHTGHRTGTLKRKNVLTGMAHVSHYTFFTQSDYIRQKRPDILNRYWQLAEKVKAAIDAEEFLPALLQAGEEVE